MFVLGSKETATATSAVNIGMRHIHSRSDDDFRREVADLIITKARDPGFTSQAAFARWTRENKALLISLFGGQGIQRLARVVSWIHREQTGRRRDPAETLSRYADVLAAGGRVIGYATLDDAVRAALLDRTVAADLLGT